MTIRNTSAESPQDILDHILLQLSPLDAFRVRAACEGVLILGSTGAGKTSTSARQLALSLLRTPGVGILVLCVKPSEARQWLEYASLTDRQKDVILFNRESGLRFDPLAYEWNRKDRAAGDIESLVDLVIVILTMGSSAQRGSVNERFWEGQEESVIRNNVMLLSYAGEPISISAMDRVITSMPTSLEEMHSPKWRQESYCWSLFEKVRDKHPELFGSEEVWQPSDMDAVATFMLDYWPRLDERTRSNIVAGWTGMASKFLFKPLSDIFCSGTYDFTPEQLFTEGKVAIIDWPLLQWNKTSQIIAGMLKLITYRALGRRDSHKHPSPVVIWNEEAQLIMLPGNRENAFAQIARESRGVNVWITQSNCNISEQLGEAYPGSKTHALLANLNTKIFHAQTDVDTNKYAADLVGQEYRYKKSLNTPTTTPTNGPSVGRSEELRYRLLPSDFGSLQRADAENKRSEAIVVQAGKIFESTKTPSNPRGRNYLRILFSR